MRVQSHIWVTAFMRYEQQQGGYTAIVRKGASEAGAIFILHNHLDGNYTVWAPAPQAVFMENDGISGRRFEKTCDQVSEDEARRWLDRQVDFDPDCWIVETERRGGEPEFFE